MKFPAYPKYKPSGVEWLGDVPQHWEVKRLKWVGESIIGLTYSPTDVVNEGEGTLVLRSSNIQGGRIVFDDNVFVSAEIPSKLRTRANDIVICTRNGSRDLVGKTGKISKQDAGLTFGAFTAVFRSSSNAYMFYVFNSSLFSFQAGLYQTSTIFQLTNGTINAFQIPLPPADEQHGIANFLDVQTARLDALLAKRRALLEKLSEKRTALISRTVTRGLNPKAKFKPSGLEWLGDIPEHWEIWKYAHLFTSSMGQTILKEQVADSGLIPVLSATEKYEVFGYLDSAAVLLDAGDLVIPARGNSIGHVKLVRERSTTTQTTIYSKHLTKKVDPKYAFYFLLGHRKTLFHFDRTAIPQLTVNQVSTNLFLLPSFPEQAAIVEFLDRETTKLDQMMAKVEAAISKLQEYRTALITAAVTGKIDVRKAAA